MTRITTIPGEVLRDEFMVPLGMGVTALVMALRIPQTRVLGILSGHKPVSLDDAFRLARYFGTTPEFWMNLQVHHDVSEAEYTIGRRVATEVTPRKH